MVLTEFELGLTRNYLKHMFNFGKLTFLHAFVDYASSQTFKRCELCEEHIVQIQIPSRRSST